MCIYVIIYLSMNKYFLLISIVFALLLAGCQLKENYAMQYSFSSELITEADFQAKADGFELSLPLADFSCQPTEMKAALNRQGNNLTILINGPETTKRCSQKFSASVVGLKPTAYQLKVIYDREGQKQEILVQDFSVKQ